MRVTSALMREDSYLALLQLGFTSPLNVTTSAVCSYHTVSPLLPDGSGLLSVALAVGLHPPGVTWQLTLWSPDFPPEDHIFQRLLGRLERVRVYQKERAPARVLGGDNTTSNSITTATIRWSTRIIITTLMNDKRAAF